MASSGNRLGHVGFAFLAEAVALEIALDWVMDTLLKLELEEP